jgi:hypothetical protein
VGWGADCTVFKNPLPLAVGRMGGHATDMRWVYQSLLPLIAGGTDWVLAKLLRRVKHVRLDAAETRRLVRL